MALIPTKKIPELTAYGSPLLGTELLEIWSVNTSRRITTRDFVLPSDSVLTVTPLGVVGANSRQMTEGIGIAFVDGGAGSTLSINATGAVAGPANPTATIGLAAVNGAALTYMRSDAAPPLSQAIVPTWTATHTFTRNGAFSTPTIWLASARPMQRFQETDAAADNGNWYIDANGEALRFAAINDAGSGSTFWAQVDRTGLTIDSIAFIATTVTVNGQNVRDAAILTSGTVATARLGSGVADATTWLRGDQTWATLPGGFTGFANPTASLGLAAVNGVATTAMRSDGAPALSQAIAPTWTAQHIFGLSGATNAAIFVSSAQPQVDWNETDGAANNRRWRLETQSEQFLARVVDDANSAAVTWMAVDRTLNVIDSILFTVGSNTATINGSQVVTPGQFRSNKDWALNNLINYGIAVSSNNPAMVLQEADAAVNNQLWDFAAIGEQLVFRTVADGVVSVVNWLTVDRTGTTIDTVSFPNGAFSVSNASTFGGEAAFTNSNTSGGTYAIELRSTEPAVLFNETGVTADNGQWDVGASGEALRFRAINDAYNTANNWLLVNRTGAVIDSVAFPTLSSAAFLVGTTSSLAAGNMAQFAAGSAQTAILAQAVSVGSAAVSLWNTATAGDNNFAQFYTEGAATLRGSITYNRGAGLVAYNTTSDRRRKKNIRNSGDASSLIDAIQVRSFDWKETDNHVEHWFVAQELYDVVPMAVNVGQGNDDWSIDPSKLVPMIVKELQSIRGRLQAIGA